MGVMSQSGWHALYGSRAASSDVATQALLHHTLHSNCKAYHGTCLGRDWYRVHEAKDMRTRTQNTRRPTRNRFHAAPLRLISIASTGILGNEGGFQSHSSIAILPCCPCNGNASSAASPRLPLPPCPLLLIPADVSRQPAPEAVQHMHVAVVEVVVLVVVG